MSVTNIYDYAPPRMSVSATGKTITRRLRAVCDNKLDGPVAIEAHADCPVFGETYAYYSESDTTFACTDINIDPRAGSDGNERYVFEITATYSNSVAGGGTGEDPEDPLDDDTVYEFSFAKYQVVAEKDIDDVPVMNGAEEKFDPPWMIDENRPIVLVTRNEASFNPSLAVEYQDTVNESAWAGVDAGVAKINAITARMATRGEIDYWVVTYEIEFRWNKWNPTKLLAQGFRYRKTDTDVPENYLDPATGEPPSTAILLNLDGTKLATGGDPVFHEFNFYREKDFSALNLGL